MAASTLMETLLMNDFKLVINEITYEVQCSKEGKKHSYATILTVAFPCLPPAPQGVDLSRESF